MIAVDIFTGKQRVLTEFWMREWFSRSSNRWELHWGVPFEPCLLGARLYYSDGVRGIRSKPNVDYDIGRTVCFQ